MERTASAFIARVTHVGLATDVRWLYEQSDNRTSEQPMISCMARTFDLQVERSVRGDLAPSCNHTYVLHEQKNRSDLGNDKKTHGKKNVRPVVT